jgi:orotate phosphoribosyltransferase
MLSVLPATQGHFRLESGYHTNLWLELDALFAEPDKAGPLVAKLAERLRPYRASGVCGPLAGGAFLAHALSQVMNLRFYYTAPAPLRTDADLFAADYRLPQALTKIVSGNRVLVVDDVISAGSSVRATIAAVNLAGGSVSAVGTLLVLGQVAVEHFRRERVPMEALESHDFVMWLPDECPLCAAGFPLEDRTG